MMPTYLSENSHFTNLLFTIVLMKIRTVPKWKSEFPIISLSLMIFYLL